MAALHGMNGAVYQQTGAATSFSQEACTDSGDHKRYRITNAAKRYWDPNTAVVVEKSTNGGSSYSTVSSGYTLELLGGYINFDAANGGTDLIRVSGKYFTLAECGGLINWKFDGSADMQDVTTFQPTNGFKTFLAGLKEGSGSAEGFWQDGTWNSQVGVATPYILLLYLDYTTSKARVECFAYFKGDTLDVPAGEVIKESIDFQTSGPLYFRASA